MTQGTNFAQGFGVATVPESAGVLPFVDSYRSELIETISSIPLEKVGIAIAWLREAREKGQRVFTCGNGGSASTASHFVCDIVKGASFGRAQRFRITALTDNVATLTAYSNDLSYDCVFVEQLRNLAEPGDLVFGISGSGNSPNVLRAFEYANEKGCRTIAMTGRDGGKLAALAHLNIHVPVPHMGRIEDAHMTVCHMIGYYFMEAEMLDLSKG
jgi:D-sedoheptulose 7-phosphate isomerase